MPYGQILLFLAVCTLSTVMLRRQGNTHFIFFLCALQQIQGHAPSRCGPECHEGGREGRGG
jgi:hypothetical protein